MSAIIHSDAQTIDQFAAYLSTRILDQTPALKPSGDDGDGGTLRSEHLDQEFVGKLENFRSCSVLRHQQPSCKPGLCPCRTWQPAIRLRLNACSCSISRIRSWISCDESKTVLKSRSQIRRAVASSRTKQLVGPGRGPSKLIAPTMPSRPTMPTSEDWPSLIVVTTEAKPDG
jgi:hypothetical protein